MLMPKRVKRRKQFRGSIRGKATRGNKITYGEYGIVALEPCWITILQSAKNLRGNLFLAGKVYLLYGTAIHAVGKEQYFKIGRLHIAIHTGFGKGLVAVSLQVD